MPASASYAAIAAFSPFARIMSAQLSMTSSFMGMQASLLKGTGIEHGYANASALCDVVARSLESYDRRPFNIHNTKIDNHVHSVRENITADKPFMRAINFEVLDASGNVIERNVPKVLLVAPMSGHFSTLLRGTVEALLPYADVTITDWKNARNVPVSAGRFDLGTYQTYLIEMIQQMGPDTHTVGVCQPTVPLLAAVSQMAEDDDPSQPLSMTLMGGPLHPSANMTEPVQLAKDKGMNFFHNVTGHVPYVYEGAGRRVYPGNLQLMGFMSMNYDRHVKSIGDYFGHLTRGDEESAEKHRKFYDEYRAVMDMPAEFYLETIEKVFKDEDLAHGKLFLNGRYIDPSKITNTALMTIEGERDDIAGPGQTVVAHDLCTNIPNHNKFAHLEPNAGHYAIFNGRRYVQNILPLILGMFHEVAKTKGLEYEAAPIAQPSQWHIVKVRDYPNSAKNDNKPKGLAA